MAKKFYAVKSGHKPGIYDHAEAQEQIKGYSKAEWKGFNVRQDALDYLNGKSEVKKESKGKSEPKQESKTESKSPEKSSTEAKAKTETQPKNKSPTKKKNDESRNQSRNQTPEPKSPVKGQKQSSTPVKAQSEPKSPVKSQPKTPTKAQAEPKTPVKSEAKKELKKKQSKAQLKQAKAQDEDKSKSKSPEKSKAENKTKSEDKSKTDSKPKSEDKTDSKPKSETKPKADPQPKKTQSKSDLKTPKSPVKQNGSKKTKSESEDVSQELLKAQAEVKALTEALREAENRVKSHEEALQKAKEEEKTREESPEQENGPKRQQKFYIVDCFIFDTHQAAVMYFGGTDGVAEAGTWEKAVDKVKKGGFDESFKSFSEDLSYVTKAGKTVHQVFVDGACSKNGTPEAKAGYGLYFGDNNPWNLAAPFVGPVHTNQQAELLAIQRACEVIEKRKSGWFYEILSDSSYAINCLTQWRHQWEKNGWKTSEGKPVENQELIEDTIKAMDRLGKENVTLTKVQAHGLSKGNKKADSLARQGIQIGGSHTGGQNASKSWKALGLSKKK